MGEPGPRVTIMEDSKASQDELKAKRAPTPGGMYRRAEMRAHAEVSPIAEAVAAAPVELSADVPSFSAPDMVAAIGHVDPVVRTIAPLADTVPMPFTPPRPSVRQASVVSQGVIRLGHGYGGQASIRRRHVAFATIAVGGIAAIWLAWPTPSITAPVSNGPAARAALVIPVPVATPTIAPSPSPAPASTTSEERSAAIPAANPVLRITSDPAGARVTVNGVGWGATPVVIRNLPAGPKTIRVTKDGYVADQRVVSFSGASPSSVQLRLRRRLERPLASTAR